MNCNQALQRKEEQQIIYIFWTTAYKKVTE